MLKGAQKRMIVVRTNDSSIFEEAYFVVKTNYDCEEMDMVAEAERIIDAAIPRQSKKKALRDKKRNMIFGICGIIIGLLIGIVGSIVMCIIL